MSAATQASIEYARDVVDQTIRERFRAMAPTHGVDIPIVASWALKTLRRRLARDLCIAWTLTVGVVTALFSQALVATAVMITVIWVIVAWEQWDRLHGTIVQKMLRGRFDPLEAPEPRSQRRRARIREISDRKEGNLTVFRGHAAFVGSGRMLDFRYVLIDAARGAEDTDQDADARSEERAGTATRSSPASTAVRRKTKEPTPFTSRDLHLAIADALDDMGLPGVHVKEQLFVNGLHLHPGSALLPDAYLPPPSSVDKERIEDCTEHPSPDARTYVSAEMSGWQGQLVVSMFVRAVHAGDSLYVEWSFHVLQPLYREYQAIDRYYGLSMVRQFLNAARTGMLELPGATLGLPFLLVGHMLRPVRERMSVRRQTRQIANGYVFNYGAGRSIREIASSRRSDHHFLARDQVMYILVAQQTVLRCIGRFLREHGIDLGQFTTQEVNIIQNTGQIFNVNGSGNVIGNNSQASVNQEPRRP